MVTLTINCAHFFFLFLILSSLGWYNQAQGKNQTFEDVLQDEIKAKTTSNSGSASDALLWLKRGMWMMAKFMRSMMEGIIYYYIACTTTNFR